MARGTPLVELLDMYRAECKLSLNPALNVQDRDRQVQHIQRTQKWLWSDYAWPILRVERSIALQAGQRFYSLPDDLDIDRLLKIELLYNTVYELIPAGIEAAHFTVYNSDLDERQDPVRRWRISENEQLEVWPIPYTNAVTATKSNTLKLTGVKKLGALVKDTDTADLDDSLLVLYCAAEFLVAKDPQLAKMKLDQANKLYRKLKGAQNKTRVMTMFGASRTAEASNRRPIAVYNKTS